MGRIGLNFIVIAGTVKDKPLCLPILWGVWPENGLRRNCLPSFFVSFIVRGDENYHSSN